MTNLEMVEKLREKANVSYEEAKDALEKANWDILDAIVLLEREGKVREEKAEYSTKVEPVVTQQAQQEKQESFGDMVNRFFRWVGKMIKMGNANELVVEKREECLLTLPVTVFVLLLIFGFWVVLPLMVAGLFFGFRYSFRGPNLGKQAVNDVMNKASSVVEDIKKEFKEEEKENKKDV